ncbi:MAG: DUF5685 family protein [Oscillospiraceae bacterium]|nr:DUF5685 family protein [Oscillospiraceae bacterium]
MFGYVIANSEILSQEDKARYKAVYCGLCRSLKKRHGYFGRLALNYDMTFLIFVLNSLYEPKMSKGEERCAAHPCSAHCYVACEITDYASDMNIALAYLNQLDNWRDDRNLLSLIYARILRKKYRSVKAQYPRQCEAMERCIKRLSEIEKSGVQDPDAASHCFGELMGEIFILREDRWEPSLRAMASSLGEFIYLSDAVVDLPRDIKKHRYNPLAALKSAGRSDLYFKDILTMVIGNCTMDFEKLPLVEDVSIMRNILYSGVWTKYELAQAKKAKLKGDKRQ